jgi:hypothetical protein
MLADATKSTMIISTAVHLIVTNWFYSSWSFDDVSTHDR